MFKWLYRWWSGFVYEAYQTHIGNDFSGSLASITGKSMSLRNHSNNGDGLNFQIYNANGGYVLEYSHYDNKKDEYVRRLHIVRDDVNLGEDIAKVITLELLRK